MVSNKGFTMQIKNNANNYISLYPKTVKGQVIGWNVGEIKTANIVLKSNAWANKRQTIDLEGISSNDIIQCLIILEGDEIQMKKQKEQYSFISSVNSLTNKIEFNCTKVPNVDIKLQLNWTI